MKLIKNCHNIAISVALKPIKYVEEYQNNIVIFGETSMIISLEQI